MELREGGEAERAKKLGHRKSHVSDKLRLVGTAFPFFFLFFFVLFARNAHNSA